MGAVEGYSNSKWMENRDMWNVAVFTLVPFDLLSIPTNVHAMHEDKLSPAVPLDGWPMRCDEHDATRLKSGGEARSWKQRPGRRGAFLARANQSNGAGPKVKSQRP